MNNPPIVFFRLSSLVIWMGLLFSACAIFLVPQTVSAKVILKERVTYYNVKGSNGREIFTSMLRNGPTIGRRENHALATTEFKMNFKDIDGYLKNGKCVITDVVIQLDVKYTYPRWKAPRGASSTTRSAWKHFSKTVVWHEKQHVAIARKLAEDYEKIIRKTRFRAKRECTPNEVSLKFRFNGANFRNNRKQKQFDRRDSRKGARGYEAQLRLIKAE